MNPAEEIPPEHAHRAYYRQPVWKRIVVIAAGPAVNIVLAFVILAGRLHVPAARSSRRRWSARSRRARPRPTALKKGDVLVAVDGKPLDRRHATASRSTRSARRSAPTRARRSRSPSSATAGADRHAARRSTTSQDQALPLRLRLRPGGERRSPPARSAPAASRSSEMWTVTQRTVSHIAQIFVPEKRKELGSVVGGYETDAPGDRDQRPAPRWSILAFISPVARRHQPVPVPAARRRAHLLGAGREGARQGDPVQRHGARRASSASRS